MAKIYDLNAFRADWTSGNSPPLTRNQEILAEINALWAARTPAEIRLAELRGTEEELKGVLQRYLRLSEALPSIDNLSRSPSEIAKSNPTPRPDQSNEQGHELEP